jgi:hypothetical protein
MRARRRCTECRCWFVPCGSATHSQKVCSQTCRRKRQRKLARRRRRADLEGFRAEERVRQQVHRERLRDERLIEADEPAVSRATLSAPEAVLRDQIVESWDRQLLLSRATFARRVSLLLGRERKKLGQPGTGFADCHAPP